MKNLIYILCITLVTFSCNKKQSEKHTISFLVDLTNPNMELPNTAFLKQYYSPYLESNNGLDLSLTYITDVHGNDKQTIVLPYFSDNILASQLERKRQTNAFKKEAKSLFEDIQNQDKGYEQSHIFRAVNRELTHLSHQTSWGKRKLILVSDLEQSSSLFSVYNKQDLKSLEHPSKVARYLASKMNLPSNLKGVEIHVIHKQTPETEKLYERLLSVYHYLYETRGAIIISEIETKTYIQ